MGGVVWPGLKHRPRMHPLGGQISNGLSLIRRAGQQGDAAAAGLADVQARDGLAQHIGFELIPQGRFGAAADGPQFMHRRAGCLQGGDVQAHLEGHALEQGAQDFTAMENGRYEINGDNVFALVQRYNSKPRDQGVWEAHRRYIDVQYIASGIESMGYAHIGNLKETQDYSAEKDVLLLDGQGDYFTARHDCFAVFYPEDAHMPGLAHENPTPVLKVVVKVAF